MPELLVAASALGLSGGTAAAGAGLSIGGGLAGVAGVGAGVGATASTASALAVLQGIASAISAIGAVGAGVSAMASANEQADATELQAGQEQVASTQRQNQMRRELLRVLGENDVAFAAAGVEVGQGGIASSTRANANADAAATLNIDRDQDEYRRALLKVRARGMRRRGSEQLFSGLANAAGIGLDYGIDRMELGV